MADHPSKEELSGFLLGKLAPDSCEAVAEHVEQCPPCQETIQALESHEDTLAELLREPSPVKDDERSQEAIKKITAIMQPKMDGLTNTSADVSRPDEKSLTNYTQAQLNIPPRDAFVRALQASGAIDAEEWTRLQSDVQAIAQAKDAAELAKQLVQHGALTRFQATLLYQGKSGLRMGEYIVLDQIGAGGMGQVFKARHRRMDRVVAIKVLAKSAMNSPEAVKRFQREVKAAAKLSHPNIVTAYDAGEQDGVHFLVMEYVEGHDLSSVIKQHGPLPLERVMAYLMQAARGLAFAHSKGVVHRDIKPANLLLDADGTVKILDMGLARLDGDKASMAALDGLTQSGQVMGTVDYMAPEQAFDTRTADAKADVYSLGCTVYRLLTGRNAYDGETLVQKILAHREQPIPALSSPHGVVSGAFDGLYRRMMAKKPEDRPTMAEVVTVLESIQKSATGGRTTADSAPNIVVAPQKPATAGRSGRGSHGGRRPPLKYLAAAAGAAALLFFGVWIIIRDKDGHEIAKVKAPDGATVTVQADPAKNVTPAKSPTPRPAATTPVQAGIPAPPGDYALRFDGDSIVDLKNLTKTNYPSEKDDITLEAYVTPEVLKAYSRIVGSERRVELQICPEAPSPSWRFCHSAQGNFPRSPVTPSRRVHVAGVRRNNENFLFVDGKLVAHLPDAPLTDKINQRWSIGEQLVGIIDEVRISNTARYSQDFIPAARFETDDRTTALYHFDEGAGDVLRDASGNGADGKIIGAKWVKADGMPVNSQPSANDRYALVPTTDGGVRMDSLQFDLSEPFTMEGYISPATYGGNSICMAMGNGRANLGSGPKSITFAINRESRRWVDAQSSKPPVAGTLVHVAGVWTTEEAHLYVNGMLEATVNLAGEKPLLGRASFSLGSQFNGLISEVRVSRGIRYRGQQFTPEKRFEPDADTLALYHFDEGTGNVLKDSSGNNHHGKIIGAKWVRADGLIPQTQATPSQVATVARTPLPDGPPGDVSAIAMPNAMPHRLAILPNGRQMVVVDESVRLYDLASGKVEWERSISGVGTQSMNMDAVTASPDGELLLVAGRMNDDDAKAWTLRSSDGTQVHTFVEPLKNTHAIAQCAAFSPDGRRVAAGLNHGRVFVWDAASAQVVYHFTMKHITPVAGLAFSPDGRRLAAVSAATAKDSKPGRIEWWDMQTGQALPEPTDSEVAGLGYTSVAFFMNGERMVVGTDGKPSAVIRNGAPPGQAVASMDVTDGMVRKLVPLPHGRGYLCGNYELAIRGMSNLVVPGQRLNAELISLDVTPDGRFALSSRKNLDYLQIQRLPPEAWTDTTPTPNAVSNDELPGAGAAPRTPLPAAVLANKTLADPAFQTWLKATQSLPADKQLEAVSKKLTELNPGFDGKFSGYATTLTTAAPKITDGVVTELGLVTDQVVDLSPVRALGGLKKLNCSGSNPGKGQSCSAQDLRKPISLIWHAICAIHRTWGVDCHFGGNHSWRVENANESRPLISPA